MYCQFFGRYYYTAIYPGAFFCGSHKFPYQSLLLSTTVLNDIKTTGKKRSLHKVAVKWIVFPTL